MTGEGTPKYQRSLPGGFETGRPGKKVRRVSPRRELAVVTLGVVASITGLGGVLAANPPDWAISPANAQSAVTAKAAKPAEPSSTKAGAAKASQTRKDAESTSAATKSASTSQPEETTQASVQRQAVQRRIARRQASVRQQATPVYSAPSQAPAAVSQGS